MSAGVAARARSLSPTRRDAIRCAKRSSRVPAAWALRAISTTTRGSAECADYYQRVVEGERRVSAARAYLYPAVRRDQAVVEDKCTVSTDASQRPAVDR